MPEEPSRPQEEDFDPDQKLFFQRRKQGTNLLPFIVGGVLVLGSGALLTSSLSRHQNPPAAPGHPSKPADPYAGKPLISMAEARALENPPTGPAIETARPIKPGADLAPPSAGPSPALTAAAASVVPEPPPTAVPDPNAPLNFDVDDPNNSAVRSEVLKRVDLMPNISATNKDKLYASVDHARKMGRVLTIPFAKGETAVRGQDVEHLKQQVQTPAIKSLLDDPTVVFVVLGYADPKGNDKLNTEISSTRAKSVLDALREKCNFQNVMHSVAMGGSTLFGTQRADKNRVVEIWAVVP